MKYHCLHLVIILLILPVSCQKKEKTIPVGNGVLVPLLETVVEQGGTEDFENSVEEPLFPLVNPGENVNVIATYNGNLDMGPSDEQILLLLPFNNEQTPMELKIAAIHDIYNEYGFVWEHKLSVRDLSAVNLRVTDMTGNGRDDIIISGFDLEGKHYTEIFAVSKNGSITDFTRVFSLGIKGNIDIIPVERSKEYYSGISEGEPYRLIVQQHNPESENMLDLLEIQWKWDAKSFAYIQGQSRLVKAEAVQEALLKKLYSSDAEAYEAYLEGVWYRESGEHAYNDMVSFSPAAREIMFYDGTILENFQWGNSYRATPKRLYFKMNNVIIPSLNETVYVNIDKWDVIEIFHTSSDWNGTYRRLDTPMKTILEHSLALKSLISEQTLYGTWAGNDEVELFIDIPRIEWITDRKKRIGTASIIKVKDSTVLQIQYLDADGSVEENVNWIVQYQQQEENGRVIRSLTLMPAILSAEEAQVYGENFLHFEQIEGTR